METLIKTVSFISAMLLAIVNLQHYRQKQKTNKVKCNVRWLSRPVCFAVASELQNEIKLFMQKNQRNTEWKHDEGQVTDLALFADVTGQLHKFNTELQGKYMVVTEMYNSIKVFKVKRQM